MKSRIIEIAELIEYIARKDISNKDRASAIILERKNGLITEDEALDLMVEYAR